ncbi:hypothetical protein [Mesorhizobium carmichaelinearum]|uniref:hypothetical protein n=1 Tax=Mesorhizobium carmichaelinearum TaxID=1208188 RepID=UPI00117EDED6|nr:hypothetical protein [Mesorhizobium carmichaelinearum]
MQKAVTTVLPSIKASSLFSAYNGIGIKYARAHLNNYNPSRAQKARARRAAASSEPLLFCHLGNGSGTNFSGGG